ncbi:alpha/beta fold hydrolase [Pseudonocardia benzenivorans]|uniref:Alpha/beta fold hydrolase n=1 Tax=Pseudonocardia benzenivorans TaxID=228005 RepID=A0ABW3VPW8_9PSEU|nr:3-oxoadipate enol-lactonase [Pseudonocardia sp. D17]
MGEPLNPDDIRYITVNGIRTRYLDTGSGTPIVLIHGGHFGIFVPMGIEVWSATVHPLARHGRVLAFDKLGQGWTDLPAADEKWTFDSVLEHATAFLEQLDLTDITLVGHSRGGLLATRLAMELPTRVRRLVVVSSASTAPAPPGESDMGFYDEVERTAPTDLGAEGVISHYHSAQAVAEGPLSPEYLRIAAEMMEGANHKAAVDAYTRTSAEHWIPSLGRAKRKVFDHLEGPGLDIPVLVVWGKDDRSAPVELGHQFFDLLARRTSDCSMYVINRAGHQVFRDRPEAFNNMVVGFVNT